MQNTEPVTVKKGVSLIFIILCLFIRPALWLLYRFSFDYKTRRGIKRPCLILSNHQTGFDHFCICVGFNFGINWVASDTIFRHGFLSRLMVLLVRPIPFSKGSSDMSAIKNMMKVIKSGGCVGMFPSGNRSLFGEESQIMPGIGKLAKKFNVPLVLTQIRGGYNTLARWKRGASPGKMTALVTKVIQPEELAAMDSAQIDEIIQKELGFNEFEWNKKERIVFRGRHKAEYLESALFWCPACNSTSGLRSEACDFFCQDCGARVRINDYGFFDKVAGAEKIPDTILEWGRAQLDYVKGFDFSPFADQPVFSDPGVTLWRAERAKKEHKLDEGTLKLYTDRLEVCGKTFLLKETTTAIIGVKKMNVYSTDGVFAITVPSRINLFKYMICAFLLKNKATGGDDDYYGY
ncbi:MAG: 1-acyl-sn-glycerol-3-phosphate acyltransferase [Spirochaetes bacterium]|nr:1-acyl-sn-glycerol-3-phosphate acyltransferase [Spirochaetota bacterium]